MRDGQEFGFCVVCGCGLHEAAEVCEDEAKCVSLYSEAEHAEDEEPDVSDEGYDPYENRYTDDC